MPRHRASPGLRETRRQRSLAHVRDLLALLQAPSTPVSQETLLQMHAELAAAPNDRQMPLALEPSTKGGGSS